MSTKELEAESRIEFPIKYYVGEYEPGEVREIVVPENVWSDAKAVEIITKYRREVGRPVDPDDVTISMLGEPVRRSATPGTPAPGF